MGAKNGKPRKYDKKAFESTLVSWDTSANIYESMLLSPAWIDLTANQQRLYLYCKAQYYAEAKRPNTWESFWFTMNRAKWCSKYKLYASTNQAGFQRDRDALINHGFIFVVRNGKLTREKTIYALWDMWRFWKTPAFKVLPGNMSASLLEKLPKAETTE